MVLLKNKVSLLFGVLFFVAGCVPVLSKQSPTQNFNEMQLVDIPDAFFYMGSKDAERERAYRMDEDAYQSAVTRNQGWYEHELPYQKRFQKGFFITQTPITNRQYAEFISDTGYDAPDVDIVDWGSYGVHQSYNLTRKYAWDGAMYPVGRADHPVVLVNLHDAQAYADWLSVKTGQIWRLPYEAEWELAARGLDGRAYPWGDSFNPAKANSADLGPHDTMAVGSFPRGASPFGVLDMSGQVYEWTLTPGEQSRMTVKGGAWDDRGCGVCRAAARHHRRADMKHILIGFRLIREKQ
jgi:formylglycine-generating enzyme required for sulfatase activity